MDYSREVDLVRTLSAVAKVRNIIRHPATMAAGAMKAGAMRGVLSAIGHASENSIAYGVLDIAWSRRYQIEPSRATNPIVRSLWEHADECIGSLTAYGSKTEYRSIFGIPVGAAPDWPLGWCQSPASDDQILARVRGQDWLFGSGPEGSVVMKPDSAVDGHAVTDHRTSALIADIESIPGCRAHLLWGPPRSGKSVAAKQIAHAVTGSWARVCGSVCVAPAVWRALDVLRPDALIIDDIDVSAGEESPLMLGLEQARAWARVIISTANVVPTADKRDGALRGAVIGRASDGALIEYRELSPEVRRAIAPDVPDELEAGDLLAQHQVELQRRATARGVTQADVDELRALQSLIGDR